MSIVKFPILNLELKLSPIAFSIFGIDVYWYAIIIVSAMIIGLIIFKKRDGLYGIKFSEITDLLIFLIPISIISARIYYVIFDYKYYINNPSQILNFRTGGLAIYGGIIGGAITCLIFCKKRKLNLLDILDYIVPCLCLRTSDRKMGKLCECRSLWNRNNITLENGNI